jgi:16S rRNA (cytosine1402-N4)-methyltransferase
LWEYGEERYARSIARGIVDARRDASIVGTFQLRDIIAHAVPAHYRRGKLHFATRTFQALRIAVNDELGNVERALPTLLGLLEPGGRLAVISFHSLEDRIVKHFFTAEQAAGRLTVTAKKPIMADEAETDENPRSRSAKLRIAVKS